MLKVILKNKVIPIIPDFLYKTIRDFILASVIGFIPLLVQYERTDIPFVPNSWTNRKSYIYQSEKYKKLALKILDWFGSFTISFNYFKK